MVDGLTPRLDSSKPAGRTIRTPLSYQNVKARGGVGTQTARPYNGPSFGKNSYGPRKAPSKQPGATSQLGGKAPQSIGGLTDPGDDASLQGHINPEKENAQSTTTKNPEVSDTGNEPSSSVNGVGKYQSPAGQGLPQRIPSGSESQDDRSNDAGHEVGPSGSNGTRAAAGGESNGNASSVGPNNGQNSRNASEGAAAIERANNYRRAQDADKDKNDKVSDMAGLDGIADNPVELMQAAQGGTTQKIKQKALEYLKKAVIREFIMPILIGLIPNVLIGGFILAGIIVIVIVVAAIVGDLPGIGVIDYISKIINPPS